MNSSIVSLEVIRNIFGGIENLLENHEKFLKMMEYRIKNWSKIQKFCDIFSNEVNIYIIIYH